MGGKNYRQNNGLLQCQFKCVAHWSYSHNICCIFWSGMTNWTFATNNPLHKCPASSKHPTLIPTLLVLRRSNRLKKRALSRLTHVILMWNGNRSNNVLCWQSSRNISERSGCSYNRLLPTGRYKSYSSKVPQMCPNIWKFESLKLII